MPDTSVTIQGTYCASDPESLIFPVKLLFILDDSGSMAESDPSFRRLAATRELIEILIDSSEEIYFCIEKFQGGVPTVMTTNPAFTRDRAHLDAALSQAQHAPAGSTPYVAALSTAVTVILEDVAADPAKAANTRYVVLFLSDGAPTDDPHPFTQIKNTVTALMGLESGNPSAGDITLHTAFLASSWVQPGARDQAIQLLREMAQQGQGEFRNFENGEALDFTDYDVTSLSRDYRTYAPILVSNITARLTPSGYLADSDADGLPDASELQFGTDPTLSDTDADGCGDTMEVRYAGTDPALPGWQATPRHCDCSEAERHADSDSDLLTDCEESLLSLDQLKVDSDVNVDGKPAPDHMIDYLEVIWNLGRIKWDANQDYDADGLTNLEELVTHMDPNWNDSELREAFAYRYEYVDQQPDNTYCYDFRVSNVNLVQTLATADREAGENLILLYFVEGPQDNPYEESTTRFVLLRPKYEAGSATKTRKIAVEAEDFQLLHAQAR